MGRYRANASSHRGQSDVHLALAVGFGQNSGGESTCPRRHVGCRFHENIAMLPFALGNQRINTYLSAYGANRLLDARRSSEYKQNRFVTSGQREIHVLARVRLDTLGLQELIGVTAQGNHAGFAQL